ncbi:cyclic pyranopterin monophosphate synthase MoaC [Collinsella ihumii]|uniref:Cyclic pyranopterin monophosphate synthase n=1 Tax=Collinsella ihumii TaxID=1720204 RepID=A0ABT7XDC7_9ACTN|nr:cyclic pyranopterin monophosphate synthase MoaC [Collinsella ihumii]MDN0063197.1 cyclic pyranopterin monophosphate synthase MoaC [Collinsella ihumii]
MTKRSTKKPMIKRATGEKYPTAVVETDGPGQQGAPDAPTTDGHQDAGSTDAAASPARDAYRDMLTHVDEKGDVRMVDVSDKAVTQRLAVAEGSILMHPETQAMVLEDRAKKGDVLACARVAGIMASKRTSDLIPMCHPLMITKSKVDIEPIPAQGDGARADGRVGFRVTSTLGVTGVTGIEMEALTATSVACLTIYDMCKAVDRGMEIVDVRLLHKEGGRSGVWERAEQADAPAVAPATDTAPATDAAPYSAETADPVEPEPASPLPGGPGAKAAAPAIAFIGYQNSGKTTLVEKIIKRLTQRGLRVGSIKHHGHKGFDIDQPGKDSWRHAQAGSRHVGLVAPGQYAEYAYTENEVPVGDLLTHYTDVDIVIVEGYKTAGLPNIVVTRSGVDRLRGDTSYDLIDENTLAIACNDVVERNFRARAAREAEQADAVRELPPFISINDAAALVNFILRWLGR